MDLASLKYAKSHEWVAVDGEIATIGITDFAVKALTDLVYVDLPAVGGQLGVGDNCGEVESVKAVSDLYSPVTGTVTEVNDRLNDEPELVNSEPYEEAWMLRIEMSDATEVDGLLDADEYKSFVEEESA